MPPLSRQTRAAALTRLLFDLHAELPRALELLDIEMDETRPALARVTAMHELQILAAREVCSRIRSMVPRFRAVVVRDLCIACGGSSEDEKVNTLVRIIFRVARGKALAKSDLAFLTQIGFVLANEPERVSAPRLEVVR